MVVTLVVNLMIPKINQTLLPHVAFCNCCVDTVIAGDAYLSWETKEGILFHIAQHFVTSEKYKQKFALLKNKVTQKSIVTLIFVFLFIKVKHC